MTENVVPSDVAIMDLLRKQDSMSVADLAKVMGVTATAIRQRLTRLMAQGHIDRIPVRAGRGRPTHRYALTAKGRRKTGANFADLAIALWQEVRLIKDPETRTGLLRRIAHRMAIPYSDRVEGRTLTEKMEALTELYAEQRLPFDVEKSGELPVLRALACPYPELAEQDSAICDMEEMMLSEVLGADLRLDQCRLDGGGCCCFVPAGPSEATS